MALENTLVYRVFGAALVQVGTGANNALQTLGYTVDGATIEETYATEPIMTDVAGTVYAGEYQKMGIGIKISGNLISWNPTVWDAVLKKMSNGSTAGTQGATGALVFTNSNTMKFALVSADTLEDPYFIPVALFKDPQNRKLASKHNPLNFTAVGHAMHLATATTIANTAVWTRTLA